MSTIILANFLSSSKRTQIVKQQIHLYVAHKKTYQRTTSRRYIARTCQVDSVTALLAGERVPLDRLAGRRRIALLGATVFGAERVRLDVDAVRVDERLVQVRAVASHVIDCVCTRSISFVTEDQ